MTLANRKFAVQIPYPEIIDFCQRWQVKEFYLFGSVLRSDFHAESDIDVMVDFLPDVSVGWEVVTMSDELEGIFQRKVDLCMKKGIEENRNWLTRRNILSTVTLIYEQQESRSRSTN